MASQDSPLSITSSVAGILTFVAAIAAAIYVRFTYLRNADNEYFQVKASLSWHKTESQWLHDLVYASDGPKDRFGHEKEYQMYVSVMEELGKLEERLLELVTEAELKASPEDDQGKKWALVPRSMAFRTSVAMSWLPVRRKALELVRQRDALGARVLFAQMSMMSSRVRDQESQAKKQKELDHERLGRLESTVHSQHEKLDRLESLVYRLMHRDRIEPESVRRWEAQRNDTFGTDDSQSETLVATGTTTPLPKSEAKDLEHFRTPELTAV
ncbi:uncharacterized protein EAE97_000878 [Botrytis byssoidea]|uniref:Uncharacterized protein n=1 Tax=Botrytis byssoidea TaxID=139641 RepID=A0A9P5IWL2_9HELO|nr:uncharacterized protein EAE97_000878 [Botrytis byssoidea]KAF7953479.1 hypothetical protein EAE97_000878 [Botrytis byssoidea]